MELMMSRLHAGPTVAARGVDAAEVTFLVRGSVSPTPPLARTPSLACGIRCRALPLRVAPRP